MAQEPPRASIEHRATSVECLSDCQRAKAHKGTSVNVPHRGAAINSKNWPGKVEVRKPKAHSSRLKAET